MPYTERLSEQLALVGVIPPRTIDTAAQTIYSNVVDMRYHRRALIVAQARSVTTKADKGMQITVVECDASGTAASTALLTGSAIHTPATVGSYAAAIYEIKAEDLGTYGAGLNAQGRYFKVGFTNSTNKVSMAVQILADTSRWGPAKNFDVTSVSEIDTP